MKREQMMERLNDLDVGERLPVWVISYQRPGTAPLLNMMKTWGTAGDVNVLVRDSQLKAYEAAYPELRIHSLPDEEINSCGGARWGAAMLAYDLGQDTIIQMDDDVLKLDFLYEGHIGSGPNAGTECSRLTSMKDRKEMPDLDERILAGFSAVAARVLEDHPEAMLGGMIKRHMSFSEKNHRTMYVLNGGVTPRQVMVYAIDRMLAHGVYMPPEFYVHGEDIGMNAKVLAEGGACWATPSFAYDHWPEAINIHESTIRSVETAAAMHAEEWDNLQSYPIKDYLRSKRSLVDGSPTWNDVAWAKYARLTGRPPVRVEWEGVEGDPLDLI